MEYIVTGSLAFIFLYIFDLNKVLHIHKSINLCFAMGVLLILFSTIGLLFNIHPDFLLPTVIRSLVILLAVVMFLLMIYSLFLALPFNKTYLNMSEKNLVVDWRMYALCRHPGVIWFALFSGFLWLASGVNLMLLASIIWTILDIIHVFIQDRWLFPKTLVGYEEYANRVPFLIPNRTSIKNCINSFIQPRKTM